MPLLPIPKHITYKPGFTDVSLLEPDRIRYDRRDGLHPEGYTLEITEDGATLTFSGEAGRFYGMATLRQLMEDADGPVPCVSIADAPDFATRGVMLDISRDKVMTLDTLKELVDLFARLKYNQLQLYVEGYSYEYKSFRHLFPDETPLTPAEIRELDVYCRERFIELAPNHNTLGHMTAWLAQPEFLPLREADEGMTFMGRTMPPSTLDPYDEDARKLVKTLTAELLESFTSSRYNAGLDEPFDLGKGKSREKAEDVGLGRVYADYVNFIYQTAGEHGKSLMMWADIVAKHPEALAYIPRDITLLEWGYEAAHPFEQRCEALRQAGFTFYCCPGTSAWTTFTGRTDNMLANIENAAVNGKKYGAQGLLITDWGDGGHLHYPWVSYAGYCYGAALAWNADSASQVKLEAFLNCSVFQDKSETMGGIVLDAGRYYQLEDFPLFNMTLSNLMLTVGLIPKAQLDGMLNGISRIVAQFMDEETARAYQKVTDNRQPFDYDTLVRYVQTLSERLTQTDLRGARAELISDECRNGLRMAELGFRIRQWIESEEMAPSKQRLAMLEEMRRLSAFIQQEHRRLWAARNKPGGLERSLAPFKRLDGMLAQAVSGCAPSRSPANGHGNAPHRHARRLLIDRANNMRELGGYLTADGHMTRWRRFIRSDAPLNLTGTDLGFLRDYGVRTVIDLRSAWEVEQAPVPFQNAPGFTYHNISFTDDFTYLSDPAYCPLSHLVPVIEGPHRAGEILTCMAHAEGGVLFHCYAGKDRTGMIAVLLLLIAGVPVEDVVADYQTTYTYIKRILDQIKNDPNRDAGLCRTEPEWIEPFITHVLQYGTIDDFTRRIGLSDADLARLRNKLI